MKKYPTLILALFLLVSCLFSGCITTDQPVNNNKFKENTYIVDSNGKGNFTYIQDAIDAAPENYTIFVYSGHFIENILINKTIDLIGENPQTTYIDANGSKDGIYITADYVNVSNFSIINSGTASYQDYDAGIQLDSNHNTIQNCIFYNNTYGIYSSWVSHNHVHNNTFKYASEYGIYAFSSSNHMKIIDNHFYLNKVSLRIKGSNNCQVIGNKFNNSEKGMYFCCGAKNNVAYHNVFIEHSIYNGDDQVGGNTWYDEINREGNYWDDYKGVDEDGDGIGDIPYNITHIGRQDIYPLMNPKNN
jgi:parallel beta-helix repeat protein